MFASPALRSGLGALAVGLLTPTTACTATDEELTAEMKTISRA